MRKATTDLISKPTFYFYDLETSGINPRTDRVMQFAGQRTDMQLNALGDPDDYLIALSEDTLPSPDAIMVTGITPQKTLADGMSEAEFIKLFDDSINVPGTIFVGFNSVRFDDEFMRYLLWRNFYDAYEWQWKDDRSRWDLLDVVRMTRALRPDGIKWPFDTEGKASNRLELLTSLNKLDHHNAHDAMSDVMATIEVARLLQKQQPKLFEFLLNIRDKKEVKKMVESNQPLVYTSGKYPGQYEKTTVVCRVLDHPRVSAALVYDLRQDPKPWLDMSPEEMVEAWKYKKDDPAPRLPVKTLRYNRCPAIAPIGVLDEDSQKRLSLDLKTIDQNRKLVLGHKQFATNLLKALDILDKQQQTRLLSDEAEVDSQLYDGFLGDKDRQELSKVRSSSPQQLGPDNFNFSDQRLKSLLTLYKARNFPKFLTDVERAKWDEFKAQRLQKQLPLFTQRLEALANSKLSPDKMYLIEELKLYAESLMPSF